MPWTRLLQQTLIAGEKTVISAVVSALIFGFAWSFYLTPFDHGYTQPNTPLHKAQIAYERVDGIAFKQPNSDAHSRHWSSAERVASIA